MFKKVIGHCSFIGHTGYAEHSREFFTALNKYIPVKVHNFAYCDDLLYLTDEQRDMLILKPDGNNSWGNDPFPHTSDPEVLNIVLLETNHYYFYHNYKSPVIFYNVWELLRYPAGFFDKLKECDRLWLPTKYHKDWVVEQGYNSDKIDIIHEGVRGDIFKPKINASTSGGKFRYIFAGRWDSRKNVPNVIRAFLNVFKDNNNVELWLSSDNPFSVDGMKTTEERLKHYGLEDNKIKVVHFPPFKEYVQTLQEGNVFLSASTAEGRHLPLIQAMACGIPSICTDYGPPMEFAEGIAHTVKVEKYENPSNMFNTDVSEDLGTWAVPDNKDLERVIKDVYDNYKEYKVKAVEDSKKIRNKFSWEKAAKKAYKVICDMNKPKYNIQTLPSEVEHVKRFYNEIFNEEVYSFGNCEVKEGDVVLDLGANYGLFSLYAVGKGAKQVYSLEPVSEVYNYLEKNTQKFKNIKTINKAVGDTTGKKTIKIFDGDSTSNSLVYNKKYDRVESVETININELLKETKPNFIKMDIEGSEYQVFEKVNIDLLKQVDRIVLEYHNSYNNEIDVIINKLKEAGFNYNVIETDSEFRIGIIHAIGLEDIIDSTPQISTPDGKMEIYQDQWLDGKCIREGVVNCEDRYEVLKKVFDKYNRPFTILDIGCNFGYYSIRAAEDYNATCVLIESEKEEHKKLLRLISRSNKKDNFIVLNKRISLEELTELSKSEHFDIVLALNVIHHYPNNITNVCDTFMKLGDNLIVETPPIKDEGACGKNNLEIVHNYFDNIETTKLGSFSRHTSNRKADMIWVSTPKKELTNTYYGYNKTVEKVDPRLRHLMGKQPFQIFSDYDKKTMYNNRKGTLTSWINGINLKTFVELNGTYPRREKIAEKIKSKDITTDYKWDNTSTDLVIHNIIMSGSELHLIDYDDTNTNETNSFTDEECLKNIVNIVLNILVKKRVLVELSSKSLGDTLSWMPYVEEYRKLNNCEMFCMTFHNNLFDYKDIKFIEPGDPYTNINEIYRVGCFDNDYKQNINNWQTIPLAQVATDVLNIDYKEIKPQLKNITGPTDLKIKLPKKYVVVAPWSTSGCKHWLNSRWDEVIKYLDKIGYKVVSLSKEKNQLHNCTYVTDASIEDAIRIIKKAKFVLSVGCGIGWLGWALGKQVIMISGFSAPWYEFQEGNYRVYPLKGCRGKFNDSNIPFDRGRWDACYNFDVLGGKKFECSYNISVGMVIKQINLLIKENFKNG